MSKLFIYYSFTGNGDLVAEKMKEYGYDTFKIIPKKSLPKSFFWGVMTGGFLAAINHKPKLVDFNVDVSKYDEIVIGSSIWNGKIACPTASALDKLDLTGKKVSFVLYSGGGESPKAIEYLKNKYNAKVIEMKEPKKYGLDALVEFK